MRHKKKARTETTPDGIQQRDRATVLKARSGKTRWCNTPELTVQRASAIEGCTDSPRYRGSKEVSCWRDNAGGTAESLTRMISSRGVS